MSVRVVARIRPLLKTEREADTIVRSGSSTNSSTSDVATASKADGSIGLNAKRPQGKTDNTTNSVRTRDNLVCIPNPKNESEEYKFQFSAVYDGSAGQQDIFDGEVAPTIKHLFNGFDVTLFAYGVTGTGKTHTMRGGKSLSDRGVIPRLLSGIFRRSRKIEKDAQGETKVEISMSYYEIYNDKIFDLFEQPEKRTPSGLPLRDNGGKTVVVGLSERTVTSLKEFEQLYDQANVNRSTSATKLNSHSSRSHAMLSVKVAVKTADCTRVSTASAIDLAGSEDNRRTENGKERMVESASINKSLFVLAQCVEAMTKTQSRIPYRESKMTRILSLGQNNGLTIMILNLAPVRSYHLDTLSSLNFANRTKKIEVKEVENQPVYKSQLKVAGSIASVTGASIQRQPLRPITASINANIGAAAATAKSGDSKPKAFSVYTDKSQTKLATKSQTRLSEQPKRSSLKRGSEDFLPNHSRPSKLGRMANPAAHALGGLTAAKIEEMVQKKVEEALAARTLHEPGRTQQEDLLTESRKLNEQVQRRLESLEQRIEDTEDVRAEGLSFLLQGKQHQSRGEDGAALKMYRLAQPFFPRNEKLASKIEALEKKMAGRPRPLAPKAVSDHAPIPQQQRRPGRRRRFVDRDSDDEYDEGSEYHGSRLEEEESSDLDLGYGHTAAKALTRPETTRRRILDSIDDPENHSPRTTHILTTINSRKVDDIKLLRGIGSRKAQTIVDCLFEMDNGRRAMTTIRSLGELGNLKGVGMRTVENMRNGIEA